jgi:hypothetical protein
MQLDIPEMVPFQESQPSIVPVLTQLPHVPLLDTQSLRTESDTKVLKDHSGTPEVPPIMQETTQKEEESQAPQETQSGQSTTSLKEQLGTHPARSATMFRTVTTLPSTGGSYPFSSTSPED